MDIDGNLPSTIENNSIDIDVRHLLRQIDKKLYSLREKSYPGEYLIVITLQEHYALRYAVKTGGEIFGLSKIRVPLVSFMNMLRPPEFCIYYKGYPVIGSDLLGELSPFIL